MSEFERPRKSWWRILVDNSPEIWGTTEPERLEELYEKYGVWKKNSLCLL